MHIVEKRGGMLVKAKMADTGSMRMVEASSMMPRRPTKSWNEHNGRAQRWAPPLNNPQTSLYSYYERTSNSAENQCRDINSTSNIGCLLLTVAAELIKDKLTGEERQKIVIITAVHLCAIPNMENLIEHLWSMWHEPRQHPGYSLHENSASALAAGTCWQTYLASATKGKMML